MVENQKAKPVVFGYGHAGTGAALREYQDRYFCGTVQTKSGLDITLAVVSDGIGEGGSGSRAAQIAVETVVEAC